MKITPINFSTKINLNNKNNTNEKNLKKYPFNVYPNYVSSISFSSNLEGTNGIDSFFEKYFVQPANKANAPSATLIIAPHEKIAQEYYRKLAQKTNMKYKEILVLDVDGNQANDKLYKKLSLEAQKAKMSGVPTILGINLELIPKEKGQIAQKYKEFFENSYKKYNCVVGVYGTSIKDVKTDSLSVFDLFVPICSDEKINMSSLGQNTKVYSALPQQIVPKMQKLTESFSFDNEDVYFSVPKLEEFKDENSYSIDLLEGYDESSVNSLFEIKVGDENLVDYWLKLSGKSPETYTQRLKKMWLNEVFADVDKTKKLVDATLERLYKIDSSIELAKTNFVDIRDNEEDLSDEQKTMLEKQMGSKLFYSAVTEDMIINNSVDFQIRTISVISQLAKENESIKTNALNAIFIPASQNSILESEDPDDIEVVNYILELINQKAKNSSVSDSRNLYQLISSFNESQKNGDLKEFYSNWKQMVSIAENYFNSQILDEITIRNLELINSIKQKVKNIKDKRVLALFDNPLLTIEQKEFVLRYGQNKQFISMISNSNIDVVSVISELVFFESANRALINQYSIKMSDIEFDVMMSNKFHQLDSENKDINIQGNKISSKLDGINTSILNFADKFSNYAVLSLDLHSQELQQLTKANGYLSSINNNTEQIRQYSQAITRTKLLELQKDKYYKDIVPEIAKLLPETEQIDLKEFLKKVDDLAKAETNVKRKKAIMKAGAIVAGAVVAGVGVYYFGPAIVAHLASGLASESAGTLALTTAVGQVNNAKKLGNSAFIHFCGRSVASISDEIKSTESHIKFLKDMIIKYPNDTKYAHELTRYEKKLAKLYEELIKATK